MRAYASATQAGLSASKIITKRFGFKLKITTDYTGLGKIQYNIRRKENQNIGFRIYRSGCSAYLDSQRDVG